MIWRSLRNAPPAKDLLTELILFLSHHQVNLPETVDSLFSLMQYLRSHAVCWFSIIANRLAQWRTGRYCSGYEGYGQLLRRVEMSAIKVVWY